MIKEKKKLSKYNVRKSRKQIISEYFRTVFCSFLVALIFTTGLAIHARNEMIKNLYISAEEQNKMDKRVAQQIITQSDLIKDLATKKFSICMQVGNLYQTAGDYANAQIAYEYALEKNKPGNYKPYYKLIEVLISQEKFSDAEAVLGNLKDHKDKDLIKLKSRSYIVIGDKYYSMGKFLSAAKNYENAEYYYTKFVKRDKLIDESIQERIVNSYMQAADLMVKSGLNSDAVRFLKKAEKYRPEDFIIRYKLAIVLADSDPEESVKYFEPLLEKIPQNIDYGVYDTALMKAANIADLDGRPTKAKYYRYRIHSLDLFVNRKVIYKNDIETSIKSFTVKKVLFTYPLKAVYSFKNISNTDIIFLKGDFVLCNNGKPLETVSRVISNKDNPLLVTNLETNDVNVKFKRKIFTRKELEDYTVKIYLYKDEKYKTLVAETKIPLKSLKENLRRYEELIFE